MSATPNRKLAASMVAVLTEMNIKLVSSGSGGFRLVGAKRLSPHDRLLVPELLRRYKEEVAAELESTRGGCQ